MYRAIIVEDELLVQVGIKSLVDWEAEDIEFVGTAVNGQVAYELIQKEKVDIVITDIKMPVMDGIELLKKCNEELDWQPQFIVLTSYEEFELARKAIQLGVVEYLIKMDLSVESLVIALDKAKEELKKQAIWKSREKLSDERTNFETIFKKVVNHKLSDNELIESVKEIDEQMQNNLCLLHFDILIKNVENMTKNEEERVCRCVEDSVHEVWKGELCSYEIPIHSNQFFSLLSLKESRKEELVRIKLSEMIKRIFMVTSEYFNVSLRVGCSSLSNQITELATMYSEATQALRYTNEEKSIFFFEDIGKNKEKRTFDIMIFTKKIISAYEQGESGVLRAVFLDIVNLFQEMEASLEQMKDCCNRFLYFTLTAIDDGEMIIDGTLLKGMSSFNYINQMNDRAELIQWIYRLLEQYELYLVNKKSDYSKRIIIKAKQYIEENIKQKIYLTDVAKELGVNSSYLSAIFKKYAGVGFSDYINRKKIEYAIMLLSEDNYKIYEVAEMLGYENAYYFTKVFKRYMYVTPKEYISNRVEEVKKVIQK